MELVALGVAVVVLIALNALFVLAEFAIVRVRPSRVAELVARRVPSADALGAVQRNLDEHLGVCQIGITLASVALGVASQRVAEVLSGAGGQRSARYLVAIAVSYCVVTGSHVLLGELLPKAIAIRMADAAALRCAVPLRALRAVLSPLLWFFTVVARLAARVVRLPRTTDEESHTEQELRILLEHFQERGNLSLRRLLVMENVFAFGHLRVKDVMCARAAVHLLRADLPWTENLEVIRQGRFTRYPLVERDGDRPRAFVHLKDVVLGAGQGAPDLERLARPLLVTSESASLELLLGEMQRRRAHAALAFDVHGDWTGFITLEDVVEEIVGTLRDEFDDDVPARLADALAVERVQIGVEADSPAAAVLEALLRIPPEKLPLPARQMARAVEARERDAGTYMGDGVAIPHARLADLAAPFALILRSVRGIPCSGTTERAHLLFVLLTPAGRPRVHQALLQSVALLLTDSETIRGRLRSAPSAEDVLEAVRAGEQASLDARAGDAPRSSRPSPPVRAPSSPMPADR